MKLCHFAVVACAWLVSSEAALGGVIVVDAAGGGSFTQIQPAVNAAASGDTILVKPGSYAGFTIDGKGLTVVGDVGTRPSVFQSVRVANIGSMQSVTLARLNVLVTTGPSEAALDVEDCAGALRFVESDFHGRNGTPFVFPTFGALLVDAPDVAFSGCAIVGGNGKSSLTCVFDVVTGGTVGLNTLNSSSAVYDCTVAGGDGGDGGDRTGPGGAGAWVVAGSGAPQTAFFFGSRSNIHGGPGGSTDCPTYGCPSDGGSAFTLTAQQPTSTAIGWILDSMVVGGNAGEVIGGSTSCPADPGEPYSDDFPFLFAASGLGFAIPSIAREGTFVTVTFTGAPGSRVYLNDSLETTFEGVPSWRGVLLAPFLREGAPVRQIKWGVIPASGELTRTYAVPLLPAGEQAQTRFLQAYRIGANGITLGSFRTLTVLDSSL
jgi:hypothetical protein